MVKILRYEPRELEPSVKKSKYDKMDRHSCWRKDPPASLN